MILDGELLRCPPRGAFNIHWGLLPEYRGANVLNWVLVNGERESGVTIHYMDEGVDTGDIVTQCRVSIEPKDTAVTLREKLRVAATIILRDTIPQIREGSHARISQDHKNAKHWPRRKPEDGLIDWAWPPERIYNLIRALVAPWPGTYFYDQNGNKIVIDQFMPLTEVEALRDKWLTSARTAVLGA
jgi:UDP-4-amino-4-deoxy-L-arabinose formyltransferase/UDP-glucuronic acid dehydrogenase (UDP-4-keto-hexauronic acid decarboxylating)